MALRAFEVTVDAAVWKDLPAARKAEVRALKPALAVDPFVAGDKVRRELIPKGLDVPNLYRRELRGGWRLVYTIRTKDVPPTVRILLVGDHKRYERFFG